MRSSTAAAEPTASTASRQSRRNSRSATDGGRSICPQAAPTLATPGHDPASVLEPACDDRQRHHIVGAQAGADEECEDDEELPGLVNLGDERIADPEEHAGGAENHRRPVPVVEAPTEECQHAHCQKRQGGAAGQQRPGPAELLLEDGEEQAERRQ